MNLAFELLDFKSEGSLRKLDFRKLLRRRFCSIWILIIILEIKFDRRCRKKKYGGECDEYGQELLQIEKSLMCVIQISDNIKDSAEWSKKYHAEKMKLKTCCRRIVKGLMMQDYLSSFLNAEDKNGCTSLHFVVEADYSLPVVLANVSYGERNVNSGSRKGDKSLMLGNMYDRKQSTAIYNLILNHEYGNSQRRDDIQKSKTEWLFNKYQIQFYGNVGLSLSNFRFSCTAIVANLSSLIYSENYGFDACMIERILH